ncbi:hypothetical protein GCM10009765_35700 [Fodinicola feengrottensis]|uniref:Serine aminopeptidase S33 domain-containing protein n=1 Tax=Fodinicola feengrottensis TaxID=435914 RepID=A0ABN2H7U8_9ACTN
MTVPDKKAPGAITWMRVLLTISSFLTLVNGIIGFGPDAGTTYHWIGAGLLVAGLATGWMVIRLRRPARSTSVLLLTVMAFVVVVRVLQYVAFDSVAILAALVLPAVVALQLRKTNVREWLNLGQSEWDTVVREKRAGYSGFQRFVAGLGAVGLTSAVLLVVLGGGVAYASWPCSFPPVAVGGLSQSQVGDAPIDTPPSGYVPATDGVKLAYFAYVPAKPIATLVFYHGSGAHSTAGYLDLGKQLAAKYAVATYLVDIRGHGSSGGQPGDAPSEQQVWQDTKTVVDFVKDRYPHLPEYVGGHSAGAGVVLNSVSLINSTVAGYAFLAPDFGLHSDTEQQAGAANFATVCERAFVAEAVTEGIVDAHANALGFAYTKDQISSAHLVNRYTVTMAVAQNPANSADVLAGLDKPLGVWIGSQDEVFNPAKELAYAAKAHQVKPTLGTIPGRTHLGVLSNGADSLGPWIGTQVQAKS